MAHSLVNIVRDLI